MPEPIRPWFLKKTSAISAVAATVAATTAGAAATVAFQQVPGKIVITVGDAPVATYAYEDERIRRPCRLHARDCGFVAANPFGRRAFRKGLPSRVAVKPGEKLRLRYGVLIRADAKGSRPDLRAAYAEHVRLAGSHPR